MQRFISRNANNFWFNILINSQTKHTKAVNFDFTRESCSLCHSFHVWLKRYLLGNTNPPSVYCICDPSHQNRAVVGRMHFTRVTFVTGHIWSSVDSATITSAWDTWFLIHVWLKRYLLGNTNPPSVYCILVLCWQRYSYISVGHLILEINTTLRNTYCPVFYACNLRMDVNPWSWYTAISL